MSIIEAPTNEIGLLRRCVRDLVALSALPAIWAGGEPADIAEGLADVLFGTLSLDLVYVHLARPPETSPLEVVRTSGRSSNANHVQEIGSMLAPYLGLDRSKPPLSIPDLLGSGTMRIKVIPIGLEGEGGSVIAGSRQEDFPNETDRLLLIVGANHAAIALQQINLLTSLRESDQQKSQLLANEQAARAEAEAAHQRLAFLAEMSSVLTISLDYPVALERLARLAVPFLADACIIDIVEEKSEAVHRLAVAHTDPAQEAWLRGLQGHFSIHEAAYGVPHVLHTGQPEFLPEISEPLETLFPLVAATGNPEHLTLLQQMRPHSRMIVPLIVGEQILGTMMFILTESDRCYELEELALAEEVARRVAPVIDHMQSEAALRRSEQELTDFFENASVGLHWVGPDGIILRANQTELNLLGYTREEYVGHPITEFHADQDIINDILYRLTQAETLVDYEARLRCKDGSIKHVLINSNVLWENGRFIHTRCFTRDITERKRVEQALMESERKLRLIAENMHDVVFAYDMNRRLLYVNPAFESLTGYTVQELYEQNFINYLHPNDASRMLDLWEELFQGQAFFGEEFRIFTKEGQVKWCSSSWIPLLDEEGRQIGVQGRELDITKRKQAEQRLDIQYNVAHILTESNNFSEASPQILQTICEGLGWELGALWWVDQDENLLRNQSIWWVPSTLLAEFAALSRELTFLPDMGMLGRVWTSGQPTWIPDVLKDSNFPRAAMAAQAGLHTTLAFPIRNQNGVIGIIECFSRNIYQRDEDLLEMLEAIGNQIGNFVERKHAEEALQIRVQQQAAVARLGQRALAGIELSKLMNEIVNQVAQTLGVEYCKVLELLPTGDALLLRAGVGWQEGLVGQGIVSAGMQSQAGYTLFSDEPVIVKDMRTETRFSGPPLLHDHGVVSGLSVIIASPENPFGVLGAHTTRKRIFTQNDIHFLQAVANVLATAIERQRAEQAQRILAEVGQVLAGSLDHETRLANLAQIAVPLLADWCVVDVVEPDQSVRRLVVVHGDPAKAELAEALQRRYPPNLNEPYGASHVLRTGQAEYYPDITDSLLETVARDAEHLRILQELGLRSAMILPLVARGRTLGALTFVWAETNRRYTAADLALAEELAYRAALAVDNARLYTEAQQLNAELEQRVRERTIELENEIVERRRAEAELAEMQRQLMEGREGERLHLAQELHDGPIQELYGISYRLHDLKEIAQNSDELNQVVAARAGLQQVIQTLRSLCGELRPPTLAPFGLKVAIAAHADRFRAAHPEIELRLELMPDGQELPERTRLALFRIYQQALINVIRHAKATRVSIRLTLDAEQVVLEMRDDGQGFEVPARWLDLTRQGHLGLAGSAERAEALGGYLEVVSEPGRGTLIRAVVPQADQEADQVDSLPEVLEVDTQAAAVTHK